VRRPRQTGLRLQGSLDSSVPRLVRTYVSKASLRSGRIPRGKLYLSGDGEGGFWTEEEHPVVVLVSAVCLSDKDYTPCVVSLSLSQQERHDPAVDKSHARCALASVTARAALVVPRPNRSSQVVGPSKHAALGRSAGPGPPSCCRMWRRRRPRAGPYVAVHWRSPDATILPWCQRLLRPASWTRRDTSTGGSGDTRVGYEWAHVHALAFNNKFTPTNRPPERLPSSLR
jgi:hypothetical protein